MQCWRSVIIVPYDINVHQRVVSLEKSGEVHRAGSFLLSYVCNALFIYCCSMPPPSGHTTSVRRRKLVVFTSRRRSTYIQRLYKVGLSTSS